MLPSPGIAWRVLAVALAAQFGISVVDQGLPTLAGFLKEDLGISATTVGLVIAAFPGGRVVASYSFGRAADRVGERKILLLGGVATAVFVALAAAAPLLGLFPLLFLAGIAASSATPAGGRLVLNAFPRHRRGLALGLRQTAVPAGGLCGALLLPWLAHFTSWRISFLAAAAIGALALIPLALARLEAGGGHSDTAGDAGRPPNRNVGLLTIWGCLLVSGQYAILAFLALDIHAGAGLSLASASLLVAVANAFGIAGRIGWGAFSDRALRYGRKPLLLLLNALALASALLLLLLPRSAPLVVLVLAAALAGFALIGFQGLLMTMVAEAAGPVRVGAAMGFAVAFINLAIVVSPPLFGLVADLTDTYRAIWAALSVFLVLAFVPAALVREHHPLN